MIGYSSFRKSKYNPSEREIEKQTAVRLPENRNKIDGAKKSKTSWAKKIEKIGEFDFQNIEIESTGLTNRNKHVMILLDSGHIKPV